MPLTVNSKFFSNKLNHVLSLKYVLVRMLSDKHLKF